MADLRSIAALALASRIAIRSTKSLKETIECFKGRTRILIRLSNEVEGLIHVLTSLAEATTFYTPLFGRLKGLVELCSQVCREFKQAILDFSQMSCANLRDWTKVKYTRGDINDLIDAIVTYKSTISICLSITTLSVVLHCLLGRC